jgi:hypothetical protein
MLDISNEGDLNRLILDEVEEDIHLDYKGADAIAKTNGKRNEISKDVSAFANSDGGIIVYGVREHDVYEKRHLPERIDTINRVEFSKEWLEQVINSKIRPRIMDLIITPIDIPSVKNGVVYIVKIPKSHMPHQAADNRYYRRFNFESVPMDDYEISDIRNRKQYYKPLILIDYEILSSHMVYLTVENVGDAIAYDVSFEFPDDVKWIREEDGTPSLFRNGVKVFPPGRIYRFLWNWGNRLFSMNDPDVLRVNATTAYTHGASGTRILDEFHIDLEPHRFESTLKSDVERLSDMLKEKFDKLTSNVGRMENQLAVLKGITGRTGLDFSITTLRNIKALIGSNADLEKISAKDCDYQMFMEVLQIDFELAHRLEHYFAHSTPQSLDEIEGLTSELREALDKHFYF